MRLHEKGVFGLGSSPPFSPEFNGYIGFIECSMPDCQDCRKEREYQRRKHHKGESRYRTTKAFRRLRSVAPREYDAMIMHCKRLMTPAQIASRMNIEAKERDRPERLTPEAVQLLLYSGVDKVMGWW